MPIPSHTYIADRCFIILGCRERWQDHITAMSREGRFGDRREGRADRLVGSRVMLAIVPPAVISHIQRDRVATVNLELEAFRTGKRERLLELIQFDPWTRSVEQAEALLTDILAMPENAALNAHFKN